MKKINYLLIAFAALFLIEFGMVSAIPSTPVSINYNFQNGSLSQTIYSSSFELRVNAPGNALSCRYSNLMEGFVDMNNLSYNGFYYKDFSGLADGSVQDYYVKCSNSTFNGTGSPNAEPPVFHIKLGVDLPVQLKAISFPDISTSALPAGRIKTDFSLTKLVQGTPDITYSFDGGKTLFPLPLYGSGLNWEGYILIPNGIGQGAISFQFSAADLSGQAGNQITGQSVFPVDTQKPTMITDLTPKSYVGKVVLDWSPASNNIDHYTIYRSTSPGVQYINAYVNVSGGDSYTDTGAIPGQTYYYRVAAVDDAGNIADLSNEVSSTSLASNSSLNASGLSPTLVGQVQNFIIQADSVLSSINSIKSSMSTQSPEEQQLFSDLGFDSELTQAISQIQSIERSANVLKLEALTSDQLSSQLNALSLKLSVAEKQIPQDITIIDNGSDSYIPSANDISQAILEFNSSIDQTNLANSVAETQDYIKSSGFQVDSKYYDVQITYLDGSTDTISVVSRNILGQVEKMDNSYFIENVPKSIASSSGEINVKSGLFTVVQSDPILSFTTDTKKIVYYVEGQDGVPALKGTSLVLIKLSNQSSGSSPITGGVINLGSETATYGGIGFAVIIIVILFIYFIFLKGGNFSREEKEIMELIEDLNASIRKENAQESEKLYNELRVKYKFLTAKKKKEFYEVIIDLPKKISKLKHLREVNKYG